MYAADLPGRARRALRTVARVLTRIVGAPDYDAYLAHVRRHHPGREPLARGDFVREALAARHERPGSRCC